MPNLKHLLEELEETGVEPRHIRIPGQLCDGRLPMSRNPSGKKQKRKNSPLFLQCWALLVGPLEGNCTLLGSFVRIETVSNITHLKSVVICAK